MPDFAPPDAELIPTNDPHGDRPMKNLAGLMKQAQQMQSKMEEMQAKLEATEVEGVAGAGLVT